MVHLSRLSARVLAGAALAFSSWITISPVDAAGAESYPFTPDRWALSEGIKVVEHRGVQAIEIPRLPTRPEAVLKGLDFTNGTIEVDVEGTTGLGPSIGFHRRDAATYDLFYVRPQPECPTKADCVQYAPVTKSVLLWDIYPGPQAAAGYKMNQWNHVKLVVSGRRLRVWVNGGAPALDVTRLEGDAHSGAIVLQGTGFLANVKVTPGAVEGLDPKPGADPTAKDAGYVRHWSVSPVVSLAEGAKPDFATRPTTRTAWTPLPAETGGLVNISRRYGLPEGRSLVWLRTTIRAAAAGEKRAAIGWNDEVWVFVNGKQVYADVNDYRKPELRKQPDGRLSLENGSFPLPLQAGDNEVVVGVANAFFGWGLMLRLDDAAGITLTASSR
ncbi:MAG: family 16 glycoside hydrolase [Vicinamibacteraceae bacterium]